MRAKLSRFSFLLLLAAVLLASAGCCCLGGLDDHDLVINTTPQPPVAAITATPDNGASPLDVTLDASGSTDADGQIVKYDWDFDGDGTYDLLDGGVSVQHTYPADGTYNPKVRVTDDDNLTDDASTTVTVSTLQPPVAAGTATPEAQGSTLAHFDATASSDPDGTIVTFDWDFDHDGTFETTNAGATPDHDFGAFGTFTVTVKVTDNDGLTDTADINVTLTDLPNVPPVAAVVPIPTSGNAVLNVVWDASGSTDSDGTIVSYDWDMDNDGTFEITNGGTTQNATYDVGGIYTVGVKVTDDDGATDTATNSTDVNNPPVAALTPNPASGTAPLDVTWDASASTDSDGTIVSFDWDMDNDGTFEITNGGSSQVANYTTGGIKTVAVRVTDDDGATDEATNTCDVNEPPVAALVANPGSGTTPLDVTWDASGSTDSDGTIVSFDWDMDNDGTFEITNGGTTQPANYTSGGIKTVGVRVTDDDGATDSTTNTCDVNEPPVAALAPNPNGGNKPLNVSWDASASSDPDGTIVQFDWDMDNDGTFEITDGGPSQPLGYIFVGTFTVGVRVTDDDGATDTATADVTVTGTPPTAVLTASDDNDTFAPANITWDASSSFDNDGNIVQYDYDTDNDGTFETLDAGPSLTLPYNTDGTYTVGVRVTDDDGMTNSTTFDYTLFQIPL